MTFILTKVLGGLWQGNNFLRQVDTLDATFCEIRSHVNPNFAAMSKGLPMWWRNEKIQKNFEELQKKYPLKSAVTLSSADFQGVGVCSGVAVGSNRSSTSPKLITIDDMITKIDPEATSWLIKHEYSHLKNNDSVTLLSLRLTSQVVASVLSPWGTGFLFQKAADFLVNSLWGNRCESSADDFANKEASEEELLGGLRYFEALRLTAISNDRSKLGIIQRAFDYVDVKLDTHPRLSDRIKKIEKALLERKSKVNVAEVKKDRRVVQLSQIFRFKNLFDNYSWQQRLSFFPLLERAQLAKRPPNKERDNCYTKVLLDHESTQKPDSQEHILR